MRHTETGRDPRGAAPVFFDPPVPPDPRFEGDLGFLGNRMPDREERTNEFFFRVADDLPDRLRPRGARAQPSGVTAPVRPPLPTRQSAVVAQ